MDRTLIPTGPIANPGHIPFQHGSRDSFSRVQSPEGGADGHGGMYAWRCATAQIERLIDVCHDVCASSRASARKPSHTWGHMDMDMAYAQARLAAQITDKPSHTPPPLSLARTARNGNRARSARYLEADDAVMHDMVLLLASRFSIPAAAFAPRHQILSTGERVHGRHVAPSR